jgi:hypothetical protein
MLKTLKSLILNYAESIFLVIVFSIKRVLMRRKNHEPLNCALT